MTAATKSKGPKVTVETVTPAKAGDWLDHNTHNRGLRQKRVDELAGIIRRGEWTLNGDAIRFAEDGTLLDGQHRLWGILESGIAVETVVIRGLPMETQETMDMGARRGLKDALTLRGEPSAARLAAAVNYWWRYEQGLVRVVSAKPSVAQAIETLDEHPTLRDAAKAVDILNRVLGMPTNVAAACYYEFQSIDPDAAEAFFQGLRTGAGLNEGSPILALRRYLEQHRAGTSQGGARASAVVTHALTIKAWNLHRSGATCDRLSWKATGLKAEGFPKAE